MDADCLALLAAPPGPDPTPKQTDDCRDKAQAQKYNYASLTHSVHAANAAVYSAYIAYLQTCIGIIGAILVTATLIASAGATWAAHNAARGTIEAARATRDSVDLSRRAFVLLHRPKLRVRNVRIPKLVDGERITVEGEIANVGDTDATIFLIVVAVRIPKDRAALRHGHLLHGGPEPPYVGAASRPADGCRPVVEHLRKGGHTKFELTTDLVHRANEARYMVERMVIRGRVAYRDVFVGDTYDIEGRQRFQSTERVTAFERWFTGDVQNGTPYRFVRADEPDPEREYED